MKIGLCILLGHQTSYPATSTLASQEPHMGYLAGTSPSRSDGQRRSPMKAKAASYRPYVLPGMVRTGTSSTGCPDSSENWLTAQLRDKEENFLLLADLDNEENGSLKDPKYTTPPQRTELLN